MKKTCLVSVDVDNLKDYYEAYQWEMPTNKALNDSVYEIGIPKILDLFERFKIKATFFIVGRDVNKKNKPILQRILQSGHEIGNHTMSHHFHLPSLPRWQKKEEIIKMQAATEDLLGYRPEGFRAPGLNTDKDIVEILEEQDYVYDSSFYPSPWLYFLKLGSVFLISQGNQKDFLKSEISHFFGPRTPYLLRECFFKQKSVGSNSQIIELPISTVPYLRFPFNGTFILMLPNWLFGFQYAFIKARDSYLSFEMHAIEMLNVREHGLHPLFQRQPGLNIASVKKEKRYEYILSQFKKNFTFLSLLDFAELERAKHERLRQ